MMAPYAIAHMKIGLKLAETGHTFPEDGLRVNVFLTNALEPAHAINPGLAFEAPMLAHEAAAANRVKEQLATVVVGNPTPRRTARPTASAKPPFCEPISRAFPFPALAPRSMRRRNWARNWCNGICWSIRRRWPSGAALTPALSQGRGSKSPLVRHGLRFTEGG